MSALPAVEVYVMSKPEPTDDLSDDERKLLIGGITSGAWLGVESGL